jgi:hypothetical protein
VSIGWLYNLADYLTISGGSLCLSLVLLLGTCVKKHELLLVPLRDVDWTSGLQEAPNLSTTKRMR